MQTFEREHWPLSNETDMRAFYGPPGVESRLIRIQFPFPMLLAWDTSHRVNSALCNAACAQAMEGALETLRDELGLEFIRDNKLDYFGGIYAARRIRGGTRWSIHAYGAAIDLNPADNGLGVAWPAKATMPLEAVNIFERFGAEAGARWQARPDAMHFQFARSA